MNFHRQETSAGIPIRYNRWEPPKGVEKSGVKAIDPYACPAAELLPRDLLLVREPCNTWLSPTRSGYFGRLPIRAADSLLPSNGARIQISTPKKKWMLDRRSSSNVNRSVMVPRMPRVIYWGGPNMSRIDSATFGPLYRSDGRILRRRWGSWTRVTYSVFVHFLLRSFALSEVCRWQLVFVIYCG